MTVSITSKAGGGAAEWTSAGPVVLRGASVVEMPFGPEEVTDFAKVGLDLVLTLRDGSRIVIEGFFQTHDGARSDLVFVDDAEVAWWAQYDEPWTCFEIAEIEREGATLAAIPGGGPGAMGALGALLAAGAAVAGGGSDPDPVPRATDDAADVTEAGGDAPGAARAAGRLLVNDGSSDPRAFRVVELLVEDAEAPVGEPVETRYGVLKVGADGDYEYVLDDARPATQALAQGEVVTETFTYTIANRSGETSTADLVLSVIGTNDAPVLAGEDAGNVSEDGPRARSGQLEVDDPDAGEAHSWSLAPGEAGRYGTFTVDGSGRWSYVLDDERPEVQALGAGDALADTVLVQVTDREGAVDTRRVTVTIDGANDAPRAADDASFVRADEDAVLDVRGNDADVDAGEASALAVRTIDGRPVAPGSPVAVAGGAVSIDEQGVLTFTPEPGFVGVARVPYTVDDGSGAANSSDGATWTVTVDARPSVEILDDAGPEDAQAGDGVLSTLDDLSAVRVEGQVPTGGTLVSLTITDGTRTLTIPVEDVAIDEGGAFTTLADLSDMADGPLAARLNVQDRSGAPETATGEIVKDTTIAVTMDPVIVRDGEPPTLTGTGEASDTVLLSIGDEDPVVLQVGPDGTWSHTPAAALPDAEVTITATARDAAGNGASATREVIPAIVEDRVPDAPEHIVLNEAGLAGGTTPSPAERATASTIAFGPGDAAVSELLLGDVTFTRAELLAASEGAPAAPVGTAYGTLSVTGFDPGTGRLTFQYALDGATSDHDAAGADTVREVIPVRVVDEDGDVRETSLTVAVTDDAPVAREEAPLSVQEGGRTLGTAAGDPGLLDNDDAGADGARVGLVRYVDRSGVERTVEIAHGAAGTGPLDARFGTLEVNADGTWSFAPAPSVPHSGGADADGGFAYALLDGDGDATSFVAQPIAITDTGPVAADDVERTVPEGGGTLTGNVTDNDTASADGPANLGSFTYTDAGGAAQTVEFDGGVASATVDTPTGTLTVGVDGAWSFTPVPAFDHDAAGPGADAGSFSYVLVDADGTASAPARQTLTVTDTGPGAGGATLSLDEADLPDAGSAGAAGDDPSTRQPLGLTAGEDGIVDVVFTQATIDALPALSSGGTPVGYALSADGHRLTASADGATVFTLVIDAPNDASGASQAVTATLSAPLDQADGETVLSARYEVRDADSAVSGAVTLTIADDAAEAPRDGAPATVQEGDGAVGGDLLADAVLGADGGRVSGIDYADRSGTGRTATISEGGSLTVDTQHGTLTVASGGAWSYTPLASAGHARPGSDTALRDDFGYRVVDGDGDAALGTATQKITVTDTAPEAGTPTDAAVDEADLPGASDPDASALTVTGTLDVTPGADAFEATLTELPSGITSRGEALQYVTSTDGRSVEAFAGDPGAADRVFTLVLTDPADASAGYAFTLEGPLDHGTAEALDLEFAALVTDGDGDTAAAPFTVTVADDVAPATIDRTIPEDGSFTFNTSADADQLNTVIRQDDAEVAGTSGANGNVVYALANGTVTMAPDGAMTYAPAPDFAGDESFVVRSDDGTLSDTVVTATVAPVSDAPALGAGGDVATDEDTAVALGLTAPSIADDGTGAGNDPTSERIGPITLSGLPAGAKLLDGAGDALLTVGADPVAILITDVASVAGATGDLALTSAAYEALQVLPPRNASGDFAVQADVTSFEVDADGAPRPGVAGALAVPEVVDVSVRAVTDDAELRFDDTASAAAVDGVDEIAYSGDGGDTVADVTIREDARFDLRAILESGFADLDGSEVRAIVIENSNDGPIRVGSETVAPGGSATIPAGEQTGGIDSFPRILVGAGRDVSGALEGIRVTLVAQDVDADGFRGAEPGADGVVEVDRSNNTVTLNLDVTPAAGDVAEGDLGVETAEDRPATFLENIRASDANGAGEEVIDSVSFEVPAGWTFGTPATGDGAGFTTSNADGVTTIAFTGGTQAEREAVLDGFTITPPAHSSRDVTVSIDVTTRDGADTATVTREVKVTVTPVAEVENGASDDADTDDLGLTAGVEYAMQGAEDEWFDLNSDGASGPFDLSAGWSDEDADEVVFALLTPTAGGGESAIGARFRWMEDDATVTATFSGAPVRIPAAALGTAEFLPPPEASGRFTIEVNALAQDFDDDAEGAGEPDEAVSGQAFLTNLDILPVADEVALTLNARATGQEDTGIPLGIRPSSSDPGETFDVDIRDIPAGARLLYDGAALTVTDGTASITGFDPAAPLSIVPPRDSNEDFVLLVDAVSVDAATIGGDAVVRTFDPPQTLPITVVVSGVADGADAAVTPRTYDEAALDGGADVVALDELVTFTARDADGSEALTVRVTGLQGGFSLSEGALVSAPSAAGADRVWALSPADFAAAEVEVPPNFSGDVTFHAQAVTTEDDGNSLTGERIDLSFSVTPAPEAQVSDGAVIAEDEITTLGFRIDHRGGDADETIERVRIRVDEAEGEQYVLYLGVGAGATPLADAGLPIETEGSVDYFVLAPAQAGDLSALADPHADGAIGTFEVQYRITDDAFGTTTGTGPTTSGYRATTFTLTATAATDAPDAVIDAITATGADTVISDGTPGDDASPDTIVLGAPDTITVGVNVASPDEDGSERVTRIIVDNVPQGVTVTGAELIGPNTWLLKYVGTDAVRIDADGASIPVEFVVGEEVATTDPVRIDMTVQVRDRGDRADAGTATGEDTVSFTLEATYGSSGEGAPALAEIEEWSHTGNGATEDAPTRLSTLIEGRVTTASTEPNTLTVEITGVPSGTVIEGMTRTVIGGVETFTESVTSPAGEGPAGVQAALDALLDSIVITAPANSNENNAPGALGFTATLNTSVQGGATSREAEAAVAAPVEPVADEAAISIVLGKADDDGALDESDASVPIEITLSNEADGAAGRIVGGDLYLQVTGSELGLRGGTLTSADGTETYPLEGVSGIPNIPDGDYHVIPAAKFGETVGVVYTPPRMVAGDVAVTATVANEEAGAAPITSSGTEVLTVGIGNDGATLASDPSAGDEAPDGSVASLIELADLSAALSDDDGSEAFVSILLTDVPEGFVIHVGADRDSAAPASNAGGDGTVNTWIVAGQGESLPPFVAILPPQHFSGTVTGINLVATSGETGLGDKRSDTIPVGDVTVSPVADGAEATSSSTFGTEGEIVGLNLNLSIVDAEDATTSSAAPDENLETATVVLTGLGRFASFHAGDEARHLADTVRYDAAADAYTITGLTQRDIDTLSVRQAASALNDQDPGTAGLQIGVSATTTDGADVSDVASATVTTVFFEQTRTTGDDALLFTGFGLDALDGEDAVALRTGEDVSGLQLSDVLENVETLDLDAKGANRIDGLTPEHLAAITDGDDALTVTGNGEDRLTLSGAWSGGGGGVYTGTIGGAGGQTVTLTVLGDLQDEVEFVA
ncbi:T1SS-143 domain-containing protein [Hasllibacter halocynthiae]|uniref:T1SS-143 domain-containing protein n=1 Tax=Hasllibacter halocynthiae TaxID=595589 RepID=A0A2T0X3H6_9RHOB|nr:VCBS domain-containing protein [Hasllibacter halocynthiae]PRY93414.1 T1SS-143 domain-containing protein [Hasllibacter halocynthiae]